MLDYGSGACAAPCPVAQVENHAKCRYACRRALRKHLERQLLHRLPASSRRFPDRPPGYDRSRQGEVIRRFGATPDTGGHGGTGIALYNGYLYAELNDRIVRYRLSPGSTVPTGPAETVLSGLPLSGDHPMHPFAIDAAGWMYVDSASPSNSCQRRNRMLESRGINPCPQLLTRGGVWRYSARKLHQKFSPAARFATGIRNADGITIDATGHDVYAAQQGRDQLGQNWPKLYTPEQGAYLPAEEVLRVVRGGDFGWPYCLRPEARPGYRGIEQRHIDLLSTPGPGTLGQCRLDADQAI